MRDRESSSGSESSECGKPGGRKNQIPSLARIEDATGKENEEQKGLLGTGPRLIVSKSTQSDIEGPEQPSLNQIKSLPPSSQPTKNSLVVAPNSSLMDKNRRMSQLFLQMKRKSILVQPPSLIGSKAPEEKHEGTEKGDEPQLKISQANGNQNQIFQIAENDAELRLDRSILDVLGHEQSSIDKHDTQRENEGLDLNLQLLAEEQGKARQELMDVSRSSVPAKLSRPIKGTHLQVDTAQPSKPGKLRGAVRSGAPEELLDSTELNSAARSVQLPLSEIAQKPRESIDDNFYNVRQSNQLQVQFTKMKKLFNITEVKNKSQANKI